MVSSIRARAHKETAQRAVSTEARWYGRRAAPAIESTVG
jgi:hypothetical protein